MMILNTSSPISGSSRKEALSKLIFYIRGHNGIKSIIATIGGNDFRRLHLGIDRPKSNDPDIVANYVLSNFSKE